MEDVKVFQYTGGLVATNAWALLLGGRVYLFDAPGGVTEWLRQNEIRPDALVLTHLHFDHVIGAAEVVEEFGCGVWAREEPSPALTLENFFRGFAGSSFAVRPFPVNLLPREDGEVEIAGAVFRQLHVPGHSPDSVCFHVPEAGLVIAGDTLFAESVGRTDFPGGDTELLLSGIREKLFSLPDETVVLPGHGPETAVGRERAENPFLR